MTPPLLAVPAALLLSQGQAKAILNVNIFDDGSNLKVTVQGTLSQLGTSVATDQCTENGLLSGQDSFGSALCTGPGFVTGPRFSLDGPLGFGGNGFIFPANQVEGLGFNMITESYSNSTGIPPSYAIDSTYALNQPFFSSATFNGISLASEGFTTTGLVGTWIIAGTSESINVFIGPPAAEVPGPLPLLGAGAAFAWTRRLRKRIATPLSTKPQA